MGRGLIGWHPPFEFAYVLLGTGEIETTLVRCDTGTLAKNVTKAPPASSFGHVLLRTRQIGARLVR